MRISALLLAAAGLSFAGGAQAADVSAGIALLSDYRDRGLTLSDGDPALQAELTLELESGFYASLWTSTIREEDFASDVELDLIIGFSHPIADEIRADLSVSFIAYPGEASSNYVEATLVTEIGEGPWSGLVGVSLVPAQRGTRDDDGEGKGNAYLFAGVSRELAILPLTLSARLGRERGYFDAVSGGAKWDWAVGLEASLGPARIATEYVGSNAASRRHALVASLFLDF